VVTVTRRALLGAGAVTALGAVGCGERTPEPAASDATVLAGLLAVERELVAAWSAAAALPGAEGETARAVLAHERAHVRALESALAGRPADGGVSADVARAAGEMRTRAGAAEATAALDAALALERAAAAAHAAALGRLRGPDARALVMALSGAEAQHAAVVALALGREPLPDAFAGTLSA
jgi:hypothetical protein